MAKPKFNGPRSKSAKAQTRSLMYSENGGNQPVAGKRNSNGKVVALHGRQENDVFDDNSVEMPRAAPIRSNKKAKTTKVAKAKRTKRVRLSDSEKLLAALQADMFVLNSGTEQMLELLEEYTKRHLVDSEPYVLRELLRALLRVMPNGTAKSKIRGILGYFTRSPIMKTYMKLAKVMQTVAKTAHKTTFASEKIIPYDRIVDDTTILRLNGNPRYQERITIMDAKVERLKVPKKAGNRGPQNDPETMPSLESL